MAFDLKWANQIVYVLVILHNKTAAVILLDCSFLG